MHNDNIIIIVIIIIDLFKCVYGKANERARSLIRLLVLLGSSFNRNRAEGKFYIAVTIRIQTESIYIYEMFRV